MTKGSADMPAALEDLPNLGRTTVMWLRAIGIRDSRMLAARGIYAAFLSMQQRGFRVTNAVLFSLAGALQNRPWREFDEAEKAVMLGALAAASQQGASANSADSTVGTQQPVRQPPARAPARRPSNARSNSSESQ